MLPFYPVGQRLFGSRLSGPLSRRLFTSPHDGFTIQFAQTVEHFEQPVADSAVSTG
jgi:hypothetical protein